MIESMMKEPLFLKALNDLARLVFYELDPGLADYLWSHLGKYRVHIISFDNAYSSKMYDVAHVTLVKL